jgi:hypothetical protein
METKWEQFRHDRVPNIPTRCESQIVTCLILTKCENVISTKISDCQNIWYTRDIYGNTRRFQKVMGLLPILLEPNSPKVAPPILIK